MHIQSKFSKRASHFTNWLKITDIKTEQALADDQTEIVMTFYAEDKSKLSVRLTKKDLQSIFTGIFEKRI